MTLFYKFKNLKKEYKLLIIAILFGLIITIIYLFSTKKNFDDNYMILKQFNPEIKSINVQEELTGNKTIEVKCKDGSSYQIYYPDGEENYQSLSASKCN